MKRIGILAVSSALLSFVTTSASAADDTFPSCTDAHNYGSNTAWYFVSVSMKRADCDAARIERAEAALARTFRRQQIAAHNPEEHKVCFYDGLYGGYVDALESVYADCGVPLSLPSVARAAVSVFTAMHSGLDDVDDYEVDYVFDAAFYAPRDGAAACSSYIRSEAGDQSAGLDELIDSVCWND